MRRPREKIPWYAWILNFQGEPCSSIAHATRLVVVKEPMHDISNTEEHIRVLQYASPRPFRKVVSNEPLVERRKCLACLSSTRTLQNRRQQPGISLHNSCLQVSVCRSRKPFRKKAQKNSIDKRLPFISSSRAGNVLDKRHDCFTLKFAIAFQSSRLLAFLPKTTYMKLRLA